MTVLPMERGVAWSRIEKPRSGCKVPPNLTEYEAARAAFSWEAALQRELDGLPPDGKGLNIGHEAVDRHAASSRAGHVAIRWLGERGEARDVTYGQLRDLTNRFANVLRAIGAGKGERVFVLAGRIVELYIAALGTLKNRSVFCPLFSAFGPEPIQTRLAIGDAKVLVTTTSLYARKVARLRDSLPNSVWYTAPTAVRMLMKGGAELARQHHFEKLRLIASVGEPLNPEAVVWGQEAFGLPIHDNWWQTETGGIMIANFASMDIKPGSMGRPLPGISASPTTRMRQCRWRSALCGASTERPGAPPRSWLRSAGCSRRGRGASTRPASSGCATPR